MTAPPCLVTAEFRGRPTLASARLVTDPVTPSPTPDPLTLKAALDGKRELLTRMTPAEMVPTPGLDASTAAGVVSGCVPRIVEYRDEIAAQFGEQGAAMVDDLPTIAYATMQASIELVAADSASDLRGMHESVLEDHRLLVTDADALANRKLIERSRIDAGRSIQGYRNTVTSTLVLVALFREHWSAVAGRTPLTLADLDRIERNAQQMLQRLNEREQGSTRLPAVELRARALSMLVRTYGEVRRMLTYVRWWQEDVDSIAPSLWAGRRQRSRNEVVTPPGEGEVVDPSVPVTPVTPDAPLPAGPVNGGGPFMT